MARRDRARTIEAIIYGSPHFQISHGPMRDEIGHYRSASNIRNRSTRRLYQVFHLARAVDSTVSTAALIKSNKRAKGLGHGLNVLWEAATGQAVTHGDPYSLYGQHKQLIDARNKYAHQAGAFPADDEEVKRFLGRCEACISGVLVLI